MSSGERLLFICWLSHVCCGFTPDFGCSFLCLAFLFVKLYCSFTVTRVSVYLSLFKPFSTCSDGTSSACHVTYIVLHAGSGAREAVLCRGCCVGGGGVVNFCV